MSLYLRGKIWWVSAMLNGKHVQQSTHLTDRNKAAAVDAAMTMASNAAVPRSAVEGILSAIYGDVEVKAKTHMNKLWKEYLDVMTVKGTVISKKTLREKEYVLERFRKWAGARNVIYLEEVDGGVAKDFALSLTTECKAKRRQNILHDLSSIWNATSINHPSIANPWKATIPKISFSDAQAKPAFTREEEDRILEVAKGTHRQWFIACLVSRGTGLRYGDVCRLEWGDVNTESGMITTRPRKTQRSSGVVVDVPMESELLYEMRKWAVESGRTHMPHDRVLPWLREWGGKGIRKFSTILKAAGIDTTRYSFHSWRHSFRSRLAQAGVSAEVAMKLCGHTTLAMSEHYNHYDYTTEKKDAIQNAFQ